MRYPVEPFEVKEDTYNQYNVADELKICIEAALNNLGINIHVPNNRAVPGFYPDNIRINKSHCLAKERTVLGNGCYGRPRTIHRLSGTESA